MKEWENLELKQRSQHIKTYYEHHFFERRNKHFLHAWETKEAQLSRFSVLPEYIDLSQKSILDVGCGSGELYQFLKKMDLEFSYRGVDISEKIIERARRSNPYAHFDCVDIFLSSDFYEKNSFDIVYSSGIFNFNVGNNKGFLYFALDTFYQLSKKYIVFNLLSHRTDDKESTFYYFSSSSLKKVIKMFEFKDAWIVEDYLHNDFTVVCVK